MPTSFPGRGINCHLQSLARGRQGHLPLCVSPWGWGRERAAVPLSPHRHCPLLLEAFLPTSPGSPMLGTPDKTQAAQFNLNFRSAMNTFWRYGSITHAIWNTLILTYY